MSEVERRPAGTMSRERRFGIAISVGLILGGGWWAVSELSTEAAPADLSYPVVGTSLRIDANSADIELRSGDGQSIEVHRTGGADGLFSDGPQESYRDGELELRSDCGPISFGHCDAKYVVVVPRGLEVRIEAGSGDLRADGLTGTIELKTSSGDIDVSGTSGAVVLEASSGDIKAEGLRADNASAHASSGDIELGFAMAPSTVTVETSSGDVDITLPEGSGAYNVETEASSGDEDVKVSTDTASARTIHAKASSGDVSVDYDG